jgi:hypothetical protein
VPNKEEVKTLEALLAIVERAAFARKRRRSSYSRQNPLLGSNAKEKDEAVQEAIAPIRGRACTPGPPRACHLSRFNCTPDVSTSSRVLTVPIFQSARTWDRERLLLRLSAAKSPIGQ